MCSSLIRLREVLLGTKTLAPQQFSKQQTQLSLDATLDRVVKLSAWWDISHPALNDYQVKIIKAEQSSQFRDLDRKLAIGENIVLGCLGVGGMAEVFRAFSIQRNFMVAIKQPLRNDPAVTERLHSEAAVMTALDHPGIARCYSIDKDPRNRDRSFMILEYVDGRSLRELLSQSRGPLCFEQARKVAEDAASAIAYAHSREIVHRDITSGNIMITRLEHTKVLDFGFAKDTAVAAGQTVTGTVLGTPYYMSPEHFDDAKSVRPASDVYSLGCVLYEMLVGEPPFAGSFVSLCKKHCSETPIAPAERNPAIPAQWNDAVVRSLSKSPSRRGTAQELRDAFAQTPVVMSKMQPIHSGHEPTRIVSARSSMNNSLGIPALSISAKVFGNEPANWAGGLSRRLYQNALSRPVVHLLSRWG